MSLILVERLNVAHIPQKRERVFIVGFRSDLKANRSKFLSRIR